jgi:ABC-2 type transport system permease protein
MFAHIFINRLKCLLRDRVTMFWTLMFPIILATLFNMALSNISSAETFKAIDIAVVDDANYQKDQYFKVVLNEVSKGDNRLFNLNVTSSASRINNSAKLINNDALILYMNVFNLCTGATFILAARGEISA